jgi:hypothetical protein
MSAHERLVAMFQDNALLTVRLQGELLRAERECRELREANANLRVERDAADMLMGAAMDARLGETSP